MGILPRTLEPESMDSFEEASLYDAMDHAEVNRRFVDDFLAGGALGEQVVDLGTGTARIPILLCDRDPSVRVLAVDAAAYMLDVAVRNVDIAGLRARVQLVQADVKAMDDWDGEIGDSVISNTLMHHIAEPVVVLRQALRLVRPGGRIFIRDLMRPASAAEVDQLTELHAGDEPEAARQLLHQSLHAALTLDEIRSLLRQCDQDASAVAATSDRHWTIHLRTST